jgi:hypothetical protein
MNSTQLQELNRMRENVHRVINSLELCRSCEKITECQLWVFNGSGPKWLCSNCVSRKPRVECYTRVENPNRRDVII